MSVIDLMLPALPFPTTLSSPAEAPALLLTGQRAFWLASARTFVCDAVRELDLSIDTLETVLLGLETAVAEALRLTGSRSVTVEVRIEPETVVVEVRERGAAVGFDATYLTALDRYAHEWGVSRRLGSSQSWFRVLREPHPALAG